MGRQRIIGISEVNYYHVLSRVVDRRAVFGDGEKRVFRDVLERVGGFCGVRCLTFCLMGNHFHLLVEIPDGQKEALLEGARAGEADALVCGRVGTLYGKKRGKALAKELAALRTAGKDSAAWELLEPFVARMNDLAVFVKELKWRFSVWYNGENGRVGTLWESRFRSVLVEGSQEALVATAAYIDLNAVRAGLADDPKDYRFCGYAEAVGGQKGAQEGLRRVLGGGECGLPGVEVLARYRLVLFGKGRETRDDSGAVLRRGFSQAAADAVELAGGRLPLHEMLRGRIRTMTDGAAIGSKAFLDELFADRREFFGARRKVPGKPVLGGGLGELCAVRKTGQ